MRFRVSSVLVGLLSCAASGLGDMVRGLAILALRLHPEHGTLAEASLGPQMALRGEDMASMLITQLDNKDD